MKMKTFIITVLALTSLVLSKESMLNESKKIDIVGEAFNSDNKPVVAVAYAVASNGGYSLKEGVTYRKPEMVGKLSEQIRPPMPGPLEAVSEIPSTSDYYDGSKKLNKIDIICKIYANQTDCVHQSSCGWCGSTNSCVTGNNVGPMEPCVNGSYIFSTPISNWNPQTKVVNENVGGVKLTVISK